MRLAGKVALITGSSRGIGRAMVLALAEAGADVAVHYKSSRGRGEQVSQEVASLGRRAVVVGGDVSQRDVVRAMLARVENELGPVDILVNNAAAFLEDTPIWQITEGQWDRVFAVNVKGALFASQAVIPSMQARRSGVILNISTLGADLALGGNAAYISSKGALNSMTRALALELAPWDIRVNALAPGHIDTPDNVKDILGDPERAKRYLARIAMRRLGTMKEVARTALFLVSDDASYITGQVINIDGGVNMWEGPIK